MPGSCTRANEASSWYEAEGDSLTIASFAGEENFLF